MTEFPDWGPVHSSGGGSGKEVPRRQKLKQNVKLLYKFNVNGGMSDSLMA